jgi:hypothetical protein
MQLSHLPLPHLCLLLTAQDALETDWAGDGVVRHEVLVARLLNGTDCHTDCHTQIVTHRLSHTD